MPMDFCVTLPAGRTKRPPPRLTISTHRCGVGLAQVDNQVFNELGKMSGAVFVAKLKVVEFTALLCTRQPISRDCVKAAPQYRAHSFLLRPGCRLATLGDGHSGVAQDGLDGLDH